MSLDPKRVVADLKALRELTEDENGAQRVAWTETWEQAREWLRTLVSETGAKESIDAAGNQWFTLAGEVKSAVLIGGHIDSVPNGGWLDGALNVVATEWRQPRSCRKTSCAACQPHIPCTPPPGGVDDEHRYTPLSGVR